MNTGLSPLRAFATSLALAGEKHKNIVVISSDATATPATHLFEQKFANQHFNMGLSQRDMVATAAGFAAAGKLPFVVSSALSVSGASWEQVRNLICYPNLNVKFFGSEAGLAAGQDGAAHQALEDFALMRVIPNMKVFCPADDEEMKKMFPVILEEYGPMYIRVGAEETPVLYDRTYEFRAGKGSVLMDGDDVGIIAIGAVVSNCLAAAEKLRKEGVSVRLVNMSSLKPLDTVLVEETASKVKLLVTAEDHQIAGGLYSAVAEVLCRTMPHAVHPIGMQDTFGESGTPVDLYKKYKFDAEGIYEQIKQMLG